MGRRVNPKDVSFEGIINTTFAYSLILDGRALLVNYNRQIVLHHFNFKNKVYDLQFSPDGK